MRHAHAVTAEEDPARPLSPRGREDTRRIADYFRACGGIAPAQIWHSPLMRSRETTLLLTAALGLDPVLVETPGLLPEDDPADTAHRLAEHPTTHDLMLVGHEPHLSALATLLARGKSSPVIFNLRKGAVIALERGDRVHGKNGLPRWRLRWHFSPELLPTTPSA